MMSGIMDWCDVLAALSDAPINDASISSLSALSAGDVILQSCAVKTWRTEGN